MQTLQYLYLGRAESQLQGLFIVFLVSYPLVLNLCSCIAGRWGILLITANITRSDTTLKKYSVPFGILLYFLRVYQLAMIATPNLLP